MSQRMVGCFSTDWDGVGEGRGRGMGRGRRRIRGREGEEEEEEGCFRRLGFAEYKYFPTWKFHVS